MNLSLLLDNEKLLAAVQHINPLAVVASAKLGAVMPLIVSAIAQSKFTKAQRTWLSVASCLAASAIICLATGALSGINWAASLVVLLSIAWGLYSKFYKPTGIAPWFERVTDLAKLTPLLVGLFGDKATGALESATRQADGVNAPSTDTSDTASDTTPNAFK